MVDRKIPHQAMSIGVVGHQLAIAVVIQRIGCTGFFCTHCTAPRQLPCLFLEGDRYVQPPAAAVKELANGRSKAIQRRLNRCVLNRFAGLPGKQAVDSRRLAVADRVAHHRIKLIAHY